MLKFITLMYCIAGSFDGNNVKDYFLIKFPVHKHLYAHIGELSSNICTSGFQTLLMYQCVCVHMCLFLIMKRLTCIHLFSV